MLATNGRAHAEARLKVAIATPWYGADLIGGAERTAWQMAHGLAERGHEVTVITTCARGFAADWGTDFHHPGTQREDGIVVRRFPVDSRDANAFDRANDVLRSQPAAFYAENPHLIPLEIADAFVRHGINSQAAVSALREEAARFAGIVVLPYPYGFSIAATEAAGQRAVLVPCLHDEPYAYLPAVESAFRSAGALAFNTAGERRLAYRIFGPSIALKSSVVGQWIDAVERRDGSTSPNGPVGSARRYLLYLGRRDDTKNVDMLVESFATFRRRERMSALELLLAGPGVRSYANPRHGIIDLGEIDDARKDALLAEAWALVQPSTNESFSRVVMEAWAAGTPVVVNARCEATADAIAESGGGWMAVTKADWSSTFHALDRLSVADRAERGRRGREYAEQQTSRERVLARLESVLGNLPPDGPRRRFDARPAPELLRRLYDGRRSVLYAGTLDASSCVTELLTGFAFLLSFGVDARLTLLGEFAADDPYADEFFALLGGARLSDRVLIVPPSGPQIAAAAYRGADLFWSMADPAQRAPLIDALAYGLPVFAFADAVAAATLGAAGMLFNEKRDPRTVAGVAALLISDRTLRATLIEGQRRRFEVLAMDGALDLAG